MHNSYAEIAINNTLNISMEFQCRLKKQEKKMTVFVTSRTRIVTDLSKAGSDRPAHCRILDIRSSVNANTCLNLVGHMAAPGRRMVGSLAFYSCKSLPLDAVTAQCNARAYLQNKKASSRTMAMVRRACTKKSVDK